MEVKSADGVSIAYQVVGSGKPTLFFVHGWCCDQSYWDAQVHHFAPQYEVVTVDLAGHGNSGLNRKTWSMESFADDIMAVVKALDLDQVVLIGHSMGGSVIVWAERRMPERVIGLVGIDTFENVEQIYTQEQLDALLAPFQVNFVEAMRALVKSMFTPSSDPSLVERVAGNMSATPPEVGLGVASTFLRPRLSLAQVFEEVQAPIRCIASDRNTVNVVAAQRHASSFEVVYMSNIGHFVMIEDPNTFNRLLDEIVKKFISYQRFYG
jgi:pimeloyl-ACP methyl ester carboxylesterase